MTFDERYPDKQQFKETNKISPAMYKVSGTHTCAVCKNKTSWYHIGFAEFICSDDCLDTAIHSMMEGFTK